MNSWCPPVVPERTRSLAGPGGWQEPQRSGSGTRVSNPHPDVARLASSLDVDLPIGGPQVISGRVRKAWINVPDG